jgi:signal transduction histidine kinase
MRLRLELLRGDLDGRADDDINATLAEIDRLSRLVDGLLAVARAENAEVAPAPVDVAQVVDERHQAWAPVAAERGVRIDVAAPADSPVASVTPGHLEQVLDNVIDNALDAVAPGGRIVMRVHEPHAGRVVLSIEDNGRGMSDAQRARAFHRFASGDPDHGTGLGLAIVHRLVTSDGGTVRLDDTPGGGTTVVVDLPAARAAMAGR